MHEWRGAAGGFELETISRMLSRHEKMCALPHLGFKMPCSHAWHSERDFLFVSYNKLLLLMVL